MIIDKNSNFLHISKLLLSHQVYNESLTVSEALEAGEIHIQSTVPILCMEEYERVCKIHVELEYGRCLKDQLKKIMTF